MRENSETRALRMIADAMGARQLADAQLLNAVRRARDAGVSWASIGRQLGVTRQAVFDRFADRLRDDG